MESCQAVPGTCCSSPKGYRGLPVMWSIRMLLNRWIVSSNRNTIRPPWYGRDLTPTCESSVVGKRGVRCLVLIRFLRSPSCISCRVSDSFAHELRVFAHEGRWRVDCPYTEQKQRAIDELLE